MSLKRGKKISILDIPKYRVYKYVIFNRLSSPSILRNRGWHVKKKIDIGLLRKGAKLLEGKRFFSYRASSCSSKSPIRTINYVKIKKTKDTIEIRFKSNLFTQQVRSMVGCLKYLEETKWDIKKLSMFCDQKKNTMCTSSSFTVYSWRKLSINTFIFPKFFIYSPSTFFSNYKATTIFERLYKELFVILIITKSANHKLIPHFLYLLLLLPKFYILIHQLPIWFT